jgi:hypothetical protein
MQALADLIEPNYPKASKKGGRPPYPPALICVDVGRPVEENQVVGMEARSSAPSSGVIREDQPRRSRD